MGDKRTPAHGSKTARLPTSLQFFDRLLWLDGQPLQIEPYRRHLFTSALDEVGPDGRPRYTMVVSGRGKKNSKTLDLVLAALYVLVIRRSIQGSDGLIAANDAGQALDDMNLARKLVAANPLLESEVEVKSQELRLRDGSATLKIVPARDVVGSHGKSAAFIGFDEIHGYRDWSLIEALSPDPTRHCLVWITSYASIYNTPGAPLYDLMQIGKSGSDPKMLFSWYSGDYTTADLPADLTPEERANPSMASWLDGAGYLAQQRARLPSGRYRRLHLNLPGSPQGAAFDQGRVLACVVEGRRSLPPDPDRAYRAWCDMSGGSSDDATLCIAHAEGHKVVIDVIEKQAGSAPFDPRKAVEKFVGILREYRVREITMDNFAGETFRRDFDGFGIDCRSYSGSASDLYELAEPVINAGEVELPDHTKLIEQLCSVVWKGGKITHESGAHDDHATACAGAVHLFKGSSVADTWVSFYGDQARRGHAPAPEDAPVAPKGDNRPWRTPAQAARQAEVHGNALTAEYTRIRLGIEGVNVAACAHCGRALGPQKTHDGFNAWCGRECESAWSAARLARVQALAPVVQSGAVNPHATTRYA